MFHYLIACAKDIDSMLFVFDSQYEQRRYRNNTSVMKQSKNSEAI